MGLLSILKPAPTKAETKQVIEQIHSEFNNAGDKLIAEANEVLEHCALKDIDKGLKLESIGFINARQVSEAKTVKIIKEGAEQKAKLVHYYKERYPHYKFITESQVNEICAKYNLICGEISQYKGFVPSDKLEQINTFVDLSKKDSYEVNSLFYKLSKDKACDWAINVQVNSYYQEEFKRATKGLDKICVVSRDQTHELRERKETFIYDEMFLSKGIACCSIIGYDKIDGKAMRICAPEKDMITKGYTKKGLFSYMTKPVEIPDPVVLHPVKGGFLIIAAWGDEASDPIVVNSINN